MPAERVPALQPQAVNDPAIAKRPFTLAPETENVYVPLKLLLVKPPLGGGVGMTGLPPPPPQAVNTARAEREKSRKILLRKDINIPPESLDEETVAAPLILDAICRR